MTTATPATVSYEAYQRERNLRIEAERERDSLKNEIFLLRKIRRAPALKPIDSAILEEFRHVEKWGKVHDGNGNTRANFTTIASNLHTSSDTIARHAERLEKLKLIEIREHEGPEDEHERKYVRTIEERIAVIDKLKPDEKITPKQGGNRYSCQRPDCLSKNVAIRTISKRTVSMKCLDCQHEVLIEETEEDTGWKPQFGHKMQKTQKQLAFGGKEPEKQLAEHVIQIPPPAAPLSVVELEQQSAQLLLDIAGEHPVHIQMSTLPDKGKYFEVARPLTIKDMLAHLRGTVTKGVKIRSIDGTTRAICYDGDNPEEWQRVKEAARLLEIVGFKSILIPSPVQDDKHTGGGHMWIIVAGDVDGYSLQQTIKQYTGDLLKDIKDVWPGGPTNMRLPGGKYVKPGYSAWCNMYDADGVELSHNGDGAALAVLEHQTPIEVINDYVKSEPVAAPTIETPAKDMGGYLEKDVAAQVIAGYNASHSWDELLGKPTRDKKYSAVWRGDRTPNVSVDDKTDLAKDFSTNAWLPYRMDKYQVHCLIEGGQNWQEFKRLDTAQRCNEWRSQHGKPEEAPAQPLTTLFVVPQEEVKPPYENGLPTRLTICCRAPFPGDPNCSNPHCPGKQRE